MAKTFLFHLLACVFASGVILLAFRLFIVPLGYLSLPYLYQISFFFENVHIIIPDITAFLEYFILAGELFYVDRRRVGCQNISSRAKRAILYQFDQSLFLHDCRIILYISARLEHLTGEQVLFHTEGTCTSKSEFCAHRAILHLLKIKEKTSVSSHYFNFTGEGPYSPT